MRILKCMEPAFIQPMQCKPAPALPAGENWTFEIVWRALTKSHQA
jgi:hypothetical protein